MEAPHPLAGVDIVGIDEAQFFTPAILEVTNRLANRGLRVIVAGLDLDYRGVPFGPMPLLMATSEFVTKMSAICTVCGNPACRRIAFAVCRLGMPTGTAKFRFVVGLCQIS